MIPVKVRLEAASRIHPTRSLLTRCVTARSVTSRVGWSERTARPSVLRCARPARYWGGLRSDPPHAGRDRGKGCTRRSRSRLATFRGAIRERS